MWGFHYLQFTSFACLHIRSVCVQKQWQEPFAKHNLVLRLRQMHVENEAPVNEPQHGGKPSTAVFCDCRRPRKPLVQHRGNRHFSKDEAILTGYPDPEWHSKEDAGFPAFSREAKES